MICLCGKAWLAMGGDWTALSRRIVLCLPLLIGGQYGMALSAEAGGKLFPTDLPGNEWVSFSAEGFSSSVSGVIYRLANKVSNGMALGGIDTGCIDLETSGLWGYCTLFNSHVPRRGPLNTPFLGLSVGGQTWVLCDPRQTKSYQRRDGFHESGEPDATELHWGGVRTAKEIHYWGHYPVADLEYETDAPIGVALRAWAPFLPGNLANSLIPGIVFEVHLRNPGETKQEGTVAFSFPGPSKKEASIMAPADFPHYKDARRQRIKGTFDGMEVKCGITASYALGVVGQERLRLGGELGANGDAWVNISQSLPEAGGYGASAAVDFVLQPSQTKIVRFVLTWHSPQWKGGGHPASPYGNAYTHMYATRYPDVIQTAQLLAKEHEPLLKRIVAWQQVVYTDGSLPVWLRDVLINSLYVIAEASMWAAAVPPVPEWVRPKDGLFAMNESPRDCPQMECIPCSFYGNIPLVYFFPELALSTLRGYKGYQSAEGAAPFLFSNGNGSSLPLEIGRPASYAYEYQQVLNGLCYAALVDRYRMCRGGDAFVREFYESVKRNALFSMNLRPEYPIGDGICAMPAGNAVHWFEIEPWAGMVPHVGGLHLAQLRIAERMAHQIGDKEFARQCREWIAAGSNSLETKLWNGTNYLLSWEPETGKKSEVILSCQLDGEWVARFHGLPGVFRKDRVTTTLATIKRINAAVSPFGPVTFARADFTLAGASLEEQGGGFYALHPPSQEMLAMTYMYNGQKGFGLELVRRPMSHIALKLGAIWDLPVHMRADTGAVTYGTDYYQNLMIWSLPAAIAGQDMTAPLKPGGLVERVLHAARLAVAREQGKEKKANH